MGTNASLLRDTRLVLDALRHVVRVLRVAARGVEQHHGISGAQLFVLHQLADGSTRTIGELAAKTFTHQSSVSAVVTRLAAAGLVRRAHGRGDARRTEVVLTAAGNTVLRRTPEPVQSGLIAAVQTLSAADRRALVRGLAALVQRLGVHSDSPQLFFEDESGRPGQGVS